MNTLHAGSLEPAAVNIERVIRMAHAAQRIREKDAWQVGEAAFMGRMLVQATLPHRDPGNVREFVRQNGDFTLAIQPGPNTGVPYGSYPRLILAWMTTEAVKTGQRQVVLGQSLSDFMRELGLTPTGGRSGTVTRFREQMRRLFSSRVAAVYSGPTGYKLNSVEIATDVDLWWDPKHPEQVAMWESTVTMGEKFFREVTQHPVPLDMRVLKEIRQSALALDLYMWLTHRLTWIHHPLHLSWEQLHAQFGANYAQPKHFATEAKRELRKLRVVWPELQYALPRGRLVVYPGRPQVPQKGS